MRFEPATQKKHVLPTTPFVEAFLKFVGLRAGNTFTQLPTHAKPCNRYRLAYIRKPARTTETKQNAKVVITRGAFLVFRRSDTVLLSNLTISYRTGKHCSCRPLTSARSFGSIGLSSIPTCDRNEQGATRETSRLRQTNGSSTSWASQKTD